MHSTTSASARCAAAIVTACFCSMTFAPPGRYTGTSRPFGRMKRGTVPVVLATLRTPASRSPAAMRRVTLVLPRVPFTWIRIGIRVSRLRCTISSSTPIAMRTPHAMSRMTISLDTRLAPDWFESPRTRGSLSAGAPAATPPFYRIGCRQVGFYRQTSEQARERN